MLITLLIFVLITLGHSYLDSELQKSGNVSYDHKIRSFWFSVVAAVPSFILYFCYEYAWWKWGLFCILSVITTRVAFFDISLNLFMKRKALMVGPDTKSVIDKWEGKMENPIRIAGMIGFIALILLIIFHPDILM